MSMWISLRFGVFLGYSLLTTSERLKRVLQLLFCLFVAFQCIMYLLFRPSENYIATPFTNDGYDHWFSKWYSLSEIYKVLFAIAAVSMKRRSFRVKATKSLSVQDLVTVSLTPVKFKEDRAIAKDAELLRFVLCSSSFTLPEHMKGYVGLCFLSVSWNPTSGTMNSERHSGFLTQLSLVSCLQSKNQCLISYSHSMLSQKNVANYRQVTSWGVLKIRLSDKYICITATCHASIRQGKVHNKTSRPTRTTIQAQIRATFQNHPKRKKSGQLYLNFSSTESTFFTVGDHWPCIGTTRRKLSRHFYVLPARHRRHINVIIDKAVSTMFEDVHRALSVVSTDVCLCPSISDFVNFIRTYWKQALSITLFAASNLCSGFFSRPVTAPAQSSVPVSVFSTTDVGLHLENRKIAWNVMLTLAMSTDALTTTFLEQGTVESSSNYAQFNRIISYVPPYSICSVL